MSQYKDIGVGGTVYFHFAANTITGTAGDGATPLFSVRLAGAAANAAPTATGTPSLLTHASYVDGLHEIAIDTTGYAVGEYAVFCTLTISSVNPSGHCGSFAVRAASSSLYEIATAIKAKTDPLTYTSANKVDANALQFAGQTISAAAGVTMPSSVASPTNITAGTITNATNVTNGVTVTTNNDKSGYALSTAGILAIWHQAVAAVVTAGTIGKYLLDSIAALLTGVIVTTNNDKSGYGVTSNTDKSGYGLTSDERTAIANEVEAQIINEADSEKVLTAITDKIASVNPDLGGLTVSAIASAVRTNLTTELSRIDAAITSRTKPADVQTVDSAIQTALGAIFTVASSRLAAVDYVDPPSAGDIADAVWDETALHIGSGTMGERLMNIAADALAGHNSLGMDGNPTLQTRLDTLDTTLGELSSAIVAPPSVAEIADAVWDEGADDHGLTGSTGLLLLGIPTAPLTAEQTANAVWNGTDFYNDPGSQGEKLNNLVAGLPSLAEIADAVWDETALHIGSGSMGERLATIAADANAIHNSMAMEGNPPLNTRLNTLDTALTDIQNKTANLPADTGQEITFIEDQLANLSDRVATAEEIVTASYTRKITRDAETGDFIIWNAAGDAEVGRMVPTADPAAQPIVGMVPAA